MPEGDPPKYTSTTLVVLIPVYNAMPYLNEALQSLLDQSFVDADFLFVDDRSTDGSAELIDSCEDPRVHLVRRKENGGIVHALNTGIDLVAHKYVGRMDADDISFKHRFLRQIEHLEAHPEIDVLGCHTTNFGVESPTWKHPLEHDRIKASFLFGNAYPHPTIVARSKVFEMEKYRDEVVYMEDYDLWLRVVQKFQMASLPDQLYGYRRHEDAVTVSSKGTRHERLQEMIKIPMSWLGLDPSKEELCLLSGDLNALQGGVANHLHTYHDLLRNIRKANEEKRVFQSHALENVLQEKWNRFFYLMNSAKAKDVIEYWRISKGLKLGQLRYFMATRLRR